MCLTCTRLQHNASYTFTEPFDESGQALFLGTFKGLGDQSRYTIIEAEAKFLS